nr:cupin domain-containing protein [Asticcacaulis machinosus]
MGTTSALAQSDKVVVTPYETQQISAGSPENFTGKVRVTSRFQRQSPARIGGGDVTFEAGARTAWHTHPLGQTLIVTEGSGWVQHWDGPAQVIKAGDVVWIPPGVKHWHGASHHSGLRHIAIAEALDGKSVTWLEHVSNDQYPDH